MASTTTKSVLSWDVGLRTLSYCYMEGTWSPESGTVVVRIVEWDAVDVQIEPTAAVEVVDKKRKASTLTGAQTSGKRAKVDAVSVEEGARLICNAIHRRSSQFQNADHVVIEQQPAGGHNRHSNVRMKVMSHAIHMYFYVRGLVGGWDSDVNQTVSFVSPASKLVDMKKDVVEDGGKSVGQLYARNKKYAIGKTAELLASPALGSDENASWRATFDSATVSKKDDLADAFLLGYYFLVKQLTPKGKRKSKQAAAAE
jgi:hypothetical protein